MSSLYSNHILYLTYHLPLENEPGTFRPWMEARLLKEAGFEVTVVTSGVHYMTGKDVRPYEKWCTAERKEGILILRTWAPSDHRRSLLRRALNYLSYSLLACLISLVKIGKVHRIFAGTDPIFIMPIVFLISLVKKTPMVLDERDLFPETAIALGVIREGKFSSMLFRMQQYFRHKAHSILAATPGIRDRLVEYGNPPNKIKILYNADAYLDKNLAAGIPHMILREEIEREFLVGYVGGLGLANDISTLLRAASYLRRKHEIGIVIIGSGERSKQYRDYCRVHQLENVFFLEAVPRYEARQLLQQMDICVQPLPHGQHFFHTLTSKTFDYHGLGKPMVFCGHGDTVRLLAASGGGIAVAPGDELALVDVVVRFYEDETLRKKMGALARRWFEEHVSLQSAIAIIRSAINGNDTN